MASRIALSLGLTQIVPARRAAAGSTRLYGKAAQRSWGGLRESYNYGNWKIAKLVERVGMVTSHQADQAARLTEPAKALSAASPASPATPAHAVNAANAVKAPRQAGISPRRGALILAALLGLALFSLCLAGAIGSISIAPADFPGALWQLIQGQTDNINASLLELRLHRALSAFVTGAALSLAGVMMQALLRNPLADPYVLGISGGAAVGALAAMLLMASSLMIDAAAFAGAVGIAMLLYLLARRDLQYGLSGDGGLSQLLLTGVILSSGCMALVSLMLSIAPEGRLRGMVFWMIGDLSGTQIRLLPWLVWGGAMLFALKLARAMNIMSLHAQAALTLGVQVGRLRQSMFFCAGLLTASAVTSAGSIGFVGLIVPHACRFALGPDHRLLLPAASLVGGAFLVFADTLARTVIAPQQLPVGVITALIGVPVFLFQLQHVRQS